MFLVFLTSGGGMHCTPSWKDFRDNTRMEAMVHETRIVSGLYLIFRIGVLLTYSDSHS